MTYMLDTSPEARKAYYEIVSGKTSAQRALLAQALSRRMRLATQAAIRRQQPRLTEDEVRLAYARRILSDSEYLTLFPSP